MILRLQSLSSFGPKKISSICAIDMCGCIGGIWGRKHSNLRLGRFILVSGLRPGSRSTTTGCDQQMQRRARHFRPVNVVVSGRTFLQWLSYGIMHLQLSHNS